MRRDWLKYVAAVCAMVATASAEYAIARKCGYPVTVAWTVPGALDAYVLRALHRDREVLTAILSMVAVNAASHLVTVGALPVEWWLITLVAAVPALVLWRVHALRTPAEARKDKLWGETKREGQEIRESSPLPASDGDRPERKDDGEDSIPESTPPVPDIFPPLPALPPRPEDGPVPDLFLRMDGSRPVLSFDPFTLSGLGREDAPDRPVPGTVSSLEERRKRTVSTPVPAPAGGEDALRTLREWCVQEGKERPSIEDVKTVCRLGFGKAKTVREDYLSRDWDREDG